MKTYQSNSLEELKSELDKIDTNHLVWISVMFSNMAKQRGMTGIEMVELLSHYQEIEDAPKRLFKRNLPFHKQLNLIESACSDLPDSARHTIETSVKEIRNLLTTRT